MVLGYTQWDNCMSRLSGQAKRDILSFIITLSIYAGIFLLWLHFFHKLTPSLAQPNVSEITLNLDNFTKEAPIDAPEEEKSADPIDEPEPEKKEEPPVEEHPDEPPEEKVPFEEPIPEEKPVLEEPEPVVEAPPPEPLSEKPKTLTIKKPKPQKHISKKIIKKKHRTTKKKKRATRRRSSASRRAQRSGSAGSSRFIARLKAKINARKHYPRIARKRKMQGSVKVRFRVTSSGGLAGLTASGPRIFVGSAKQAVRSAFPISTKGASLPMSVSLTLNYRLKK